MFSQQEYRSYKQLALALIK